MSHHIQFLLIQKKAISINILIILEPTTFAFFEIDPLRDYLPIQGLRIEQTTRFTFVATIASNTSRLTLCVGVRVN